MNPDIVMGGWHIQDRYTDLVLNVIDPVAFKSSLAVVYWTIYHPQYTTPNRN